MKNLFERSIPRRLFIFGSAAVLAIILYSLLAPAADHFTGPPWWNLWRNLIALGFVLLLFWLNSRAGAGDWQAEVSVGLFAVLLFLSIAFTLHDTSYTLGGIKGDNLFETAQVEKFIHTAKNTDFAYKDLPAFYPPLYYYILGRIGALTGLQAYQLMKFGLLAITFSLPVLTFLFWRPLVSPRAALLVAFSLFFYQDWFKPQVWLALILFIPWWLYFVEEASERFTPNRWSWLAVGGLLGAALFSLQYYWFFIGAASMVATSLLARWIGKDPDNSFKDKLLMLTSAAIFSLPYWGPYLLSMARTGGWHPLQNRYFISSFDNIPLPFLNPGLPGLILLGGLIFLLVRFSEERVSFTLLALVAGGYLWMFFGQLTMLLDTPLLSIKASELVTVALAAAAFFGLDELLGQQGKNLRFVLVITAALMFSFTRSLPPGLDEKSLQYSYEANIPAEQLAVLDQALAPLGADPVLLADRDLSTLTAFRPIYLFNTWAAFFSHPAGLFDARVATIDELTQIQDPAELVQALQNTPFGPIDAVIVKVTDQGYRISLVPPNFPTGSDPLDLYFSPGVFTPDNFKTYPMPDEYLVLVPEQ